jgi:hypothetical protein
VPELAEGEEVTIEEYVPPSEFEVAKGVVKDVFEEYIPEEQRMVVAMASAALFVTVILLLFKLLSGGDEK